MSLHKLESRNFGLDIARAFAIFLVLGAHLIGKINRTEIRGLWYIASFGVDIFFALSGFLIGNILLKMCDQQKGTFPPSMVFLFLVRRWFRTVPLYIVMLLVNFFIGKFLLHSITTLDYHYFFWLQNFNHPLDGFFAESWSLSVEEWFYLIFPVSLSLFLILFFPFKIYFRNKMLLFTLCYILFFSFIRNAGAAFDYSEGRIVIYRQDTIAYGVLMVIIYNFFNYKKFRSLILSGAVILCVTAIVLFLFRSYTGSWYMLYYILAGLGLAIIVMYMTEINDKKNPSAIRKIISFLSRISYSIYLVNVVVIKVALNFFSPVSVPAKCLLMIICFILILFFSWGTYRLIEIPFLHVRDRFFPAEKRQLSTIS